LKNQTPITISIQGEATEQVDQFIYLGGQMGERADADSERDLQ